jgi:hypothetical protein
MKIRRKPPRVIEVPVSALTDPMALVTALSAARLAAGLPVAYWDHEHAGSSRSSRPGSIAAGWPQ